MTGSNSAIVFATPAYSALAAVIRSSHNSRGTATPSWSGRARPTRPACDIRHLLVSVVLTLPPGATLAEARAPFAVETGAPIPLAPGYALAGQGRGSQGCSWSADELGVSSSGVGVARVVGVLGDTAGVVLAVAVVGVVVLGVAVVAVDVAAAGGSTVSSDPASTLTVPGVRFGSGFSMMAPVICDITASA